MFQLGPVLIKTNHWQFTVAWPAEQLWFSWEWVLSTFLVEIMAAIFDFYGSERLYQGGNQDSKEGEGRK